MLYEDHFCQFLYVLALSGFGKGTYINTGEGGSSGGLEQVFDTALSDVTQLHDLSWFLPTWCVLGGPSQWTTRFGESVTFDSLVRQHMGNRNEPRCQACRGTHWCLALAYVLKSSEGLLSVESRKAAETTMGQMLRLAATAMDDSGGFRLNWNTSRENQSAEQLLDGRARLGHQGHMLEWVIVSISKEELQDSEWVHRAVEWLLRELEEQFGYDTKHAMHLVRLLRMGAEILSTGQVNVLRSDATELLEIRNGKWSYDELLEYATSMDNEIRGHLYRNSDLRPRVDIRQAANILFITRELAWDATDGSG